MRKHNGLFITFEKTAEGLGGTTQAQLLYQNLKGADADVILTREPGGTEVGQKLRSIMLDAAIDLSKSAELFIMMADRSQHYKEILKPALKAGKIVICDRYFDSTLVYQGGAQGWKPAFLWRLHQATTGLLIPDLTFVLHGTPHRPLSSDDRLENQGEAFHQRVQKTMLCIASKSERYVMIDANREISIIAENILQILKAKFPDCMPPGLTS
jgi:dTMP kinase